MTQHDMTWHDTASHLPLASDVNGVLLPPEPQCPLGDRLVLGCAATNLARLVRLLADLLLRREALTVNRIKYGQ